MMANFLSCTLRYMCSLALVRIILCSWNSDYFHFALVRKYALEMAEQLVPGCGTLNDSKTCTFIWLQAIKAIGYTYHSLPLYLPARLVGDRMSQGEHSSQKGVFVSCVLWVTKLIFMHFQKSPPLWCNGVVCVCVWCICLCVWCICLYVWCLCGAFVCMWQCVCV